MGLTTFPFHLLCRWWWIDVQICLPATCIFATCCQYTWSGLRICHCLSCCLSSTFQLWSFNKMWVHNGSDRLPMYDTNYVLWIWWLTFSDAKLLNYNDCAFAMSTFSLPFFFLSGDISFIAFFFIGHNDSQDLYLPMFPILKWYYNHVVRWAL